MNSDLQSLVDDRLGEAGPWHKVVDPLRAERRSWNTCAAMLREQTGLEVDRLTGETLRRWSAARVAAGEREVAAVYGTAGHTSAPAHSERQHRAEDRL